MFVGVYGAFELNRYQQNQRENKIEENYFKSFYSELNKLTYDIQKTKESIDEAIDTFEAALANGQKPDLKPVNLRFYASMLITKAGFNDDVFTQLSPDLAASLSGGYDNVMVAMREVDNFNATCDRILISTEPINFYERNGQLKPEFDWYLLGLKRLQSRFKILSTMMNDGAKPAVDRIIKELG